MQKIPNLRYLMHDELDQQLPTAHQLLHELNTHGISKIRGWSVHRDGERIWLTNPYGVDSAFLPLSVEGCENVLSWIAADTHESE